MLFAKQKKRIYLDYASATPVRHEVFDAMKPYWTNQFGNGSAIHQEGVIARTAIEGARGEIARLLHVREEGIVFTASGTESNNLALFGTVEMHRKKGTAYEDMEIISTQLEHPSVLEVLKQLEGRGVRIVFADVDEQGLIQAKSLEESITEKTILVTFAYANSEIGTVQHVGKLARIVRTGEKKHQTHIYVHVDAAQAPLWLSCELDKLAVDMLSLDAGKCYGPKGCGVLAFRHGVTLSGFMFGGSQEGGLRPGTENTPLIVGTAKAISVAQENYQARSESIKKMRDFFISELETIDGVVLNGSKNDRVANNINISIPGIDSEFAVITLDSHGIACSTKSACGGAKGDGSAVVRTITQSGERAASTIRFTLGEATTHSELEKTVGILRSHVAKMLAFKENILPNSLK